MPARKESPPVQIIQRVKRKPASPPVVVEKRANPPRVQTESQRDQPRQSTAQSSPKPVVVEKVKVSPPEPAAAPQPEPPRKPPSSPEAEAAQAEARKRLSQEARKLLHQIMERWPQTYPSDYRAIRPLMSPQVMKQLRQYFPEHHRLLIQHAVGLWHQRYGVAYLQATIAGGSRYDLEGEAIGEVTPEEQARSRELLKAAYVRKRAKQQGKVDVVVQELFARWPQVFGGPPGALKPLKRGLEADLAVHLPEVAPAVIEQALSRWERVRAVAYLRAVAAGGPRYDLAGQPCGEVTPEEAEAAQQHLEVLSAEQEAKRQAREQQQRPASSPSAAQESQVKEAGHS